MVLLAKASSDIEGVEACLQRALNVARHQQGRVWELRAALPLARLWLSQGKTTEARDLLGPVYGWFTEGFDTADLKEAKALRPAFRISPPRSNHRSARRGDAFR